MEAASRLRRRSQSGPMRVSNHWSRTAVASPRTISRISTSTIRRACGAPSTESTAWRRGYGEVSSRSSYVAELAHDAVQQARNASNSTASLSAIQKLENRGSVPPDS